VKRKSFLSIKASIVFVVFPLVVGCANIPSSEIQAPRAKNKIIAGPVLDEEVSTSLASVATLSKPEFASMPWGENVFLQAGAPYFSASGRNCREITLLDVEGNESLQLACEFRDGSWEPVRLVTQLLGTL
jgi:hypothetical protein